MNKLSAIKKVTKFTIILCLSGLTFLLSGCDDDTTDVINNGGDETPQATYQPSDFDRAETCRTCHPQHFEEWEGSMHAYAMKDPVWLAVRDLGQSQYVNWLDGACSHCHSPIGKFSGDVKWGPLDDQELDPVTMEGIGCDLCHTVTAIKSLSNNGLVFEPSDTKYGTIAHPVETSAHKSEFSSLYSSSEYCGSCHDFITDGGLELEMLFDEWRRDGFGMTGKTCNDCHMKEYVGPAAIGGPTRTLHRHDFIGVDVALIDFPNKPEQLALVDEMLKSALSLSIEGIPGQISPGSFTIDVELTNDLTGHNVPSGVPFNRQMWISVRLLDDQENEIYTTGQLDANNDLMDDNSAFSQRDTDLWNAQAQMLRADSAKTGVTWDAEYLTNPAIKPNETRTISYDISVPNSAATSYTLEVTLKFRSFGPYLFRALDLEEFLPIPIIDMAGDTIIISSK